MLDMKIKKLTILNSLLHIVVLLCRALTESESCGTSLLTSVTSCVCVSSCVCVVDKVVPQLH